MTCTITLHKINFKILQKDKSEDSPILVIMPCAYPDSLILTYIFLSSRRIVVHQRQVRPVFQLSPLCDVPGARPTDYLDFFTFHRYIWRTPTQRCHPFHIRKPSRMTSCAIESRSRPNPASDFLGHTKLITSFSGPPASVFCSQSLFYLFIT